SRPVRRNGEAALQRGLGRSLEPPARDDRTVREGPRDRRWLSRPRRRNRATGLRARTTTARRLRAPEHPWPEDEHVARPLRSGARDGPGLAGRAAAAPL